MIAPAVPLVAVYSEGAGGRVAYVPVFAIDDEGYAMVTGHNRFGRLERAHTFSHFAYLSSDAEDVMKAQTKEVPKTIASGVDF